MAQYGREQLMKPEGHHTEEHAHNPLHSTTATHDTETTIGTGAGLGCQEMKHGGDHVDEHKSSATANVVDGVGLGGYEGSEGHENKGMMKKIKEKLPGGDHGEDEHKSSTATTVDGGVGVGGCEGGEVHEKKGLMEKIKEKLPGGN